MARIAERDVRIADLQRQAAQDRTTLTPSETLIAAELYRDPHELEKHAHVVDFAEIEENEFNLNIPRYVYTFEPEPQFEVPEALEGIARS